MLDGNTRERPGEFDQRAPAFGLSKSTGTGGPTFLEFLPVYVPWRFLPEACASIHQPHHRAPRTVYELNGQLIQTLGVLRKLGGVLLPFLPRKPSPSPRVRAEWWAP